MPVTIIEDVAVKEAGAVFAVRGDKKIIVMDPALSETEKQELVRELLDQ